MEKYSNTKSTSIGLFLVTAINSTLKQTLPGYFYNRLLSRENQKFPNEGPKEGTASTSKKHLSDRMEELRSTVQETLFTGLSAFK